MQSTRGGNPLQAGWILVTGLFSLCALGTWLTAHTYREHVFSSHDATVLENQWPESRIAAIFPPADTARILPGMVAKITCGQETNLLTGSVVSIGIGTNASAVMIRLDGASGPRLKSGQECEVTVDSTIPRKALSPP